ncbi:MAG: peptidylprolyl isomerase [Terracidiphilus sp.]
MIARLPIRFLARRFPFALALMLACLHTAAQSPAPQSSSTASPPADEASAPVVLDRVVAVVNNQAILESDLDEEMRLSVLEPNLPGRGRETSESALRRLISRALIRQQIREEDAQTAEPTAKQVNDRIAELRRQLPACLRANCATNAGWQVFLAAHGLTEDAVRNYLQNRLEVLNFIELRFRQGIQISPQEIADYYQDTLLPQYLVGEPTPPLDKVAPRIEEILLQQKVNALFSGWLDNLRQQGEVEVLVPALEAAARPSTSAGGTP